MGNGIYLKKSMDEYLALDAVSSSRLKKILISPADYLASLSVKSKDTRSTDLGTAIHTALLEPHLLDETVAVQPEDWGPKNKGEGYKKWKEFRSENKGKILIDFEDSKKLNGAIDGRKNVSEVLSSGDPEVTAICEHNGLLYKARTDFLSTDGIFWDIKTTSSEISDTALCRTIFRYGYHFQAAHHTWVFEQCGVKPEGYGWIFVSTGTDAVHIIPRICSSELMEAGIYDHAYARALLEECVKTKEWPGTAYSVEEIGLPEFAKSYYEGVV